MRKPAALVCPLGHPKSEPMASNRNKRYCRTCHAAWHRARAQKLGEQHREVKRRYYADHAERQREVNREAVRKYRQTEHGAIARKAHRIVSKAIAAGRLERKPCQECGAERTHGHHYRGYDFPLDVIWLCPLHHKRAHMEAVA